MNIKTLNFNILIYYVFGTVYMVLFFKSCDFKNFSQMSQMMQIFTFDYLLIHIIGIKILNH
ncbi:hypothetical protein IW22_17340 [Chryseobacterium sp. JM1]|nr:hypothetical protein IW22_17340 [Chryseobacterium sp. JM1]